MYVLDNPLTDIHAFIGYRYVYVMQAYLIAKCMGPTWGPPGSCRLQVGPM